MKVTKIRSIIFVICAMLLITGCGSSKQQATTKPDQPDFPKKEITMIVPWNAGGGNDVAARKLQVILKEQGISSVVKNVPGGNGVVGISEVMTSKPDGYTVGLQTSTTLSSMALGKSKIKPEQLSNIALMVDEPHVMIVKGDARWNSLKELVEYMKANPNKVTVATPGTNNVNHAVAAMLGVTANVQYLHVPFDGGALVIPQILGGHVDVAVLKPSEVVAQVKDKKFKALAVNDDKRLAVLPDVPTFKESGYDLFKAGPVKQMTFLVGPAGLDPKVRDRLIEIFNKAIQADAYQKLAKDSGFITPQKTPAELDKDVNAFMTSEAFTKIFK